MRIDRSIAGTPLLNASRPPRDTRMARALRFLILAAGAFLWPTSEAAACSCMGGIPICESFWRTPVVFEGEALEIENTPNPNGAQHSPHRRVRFRVDRTLKGEVAGTVELTTGSGGGDCGYTFERGVRYLVYAYSSGGRLSTGICTRTRRLAAAAEDLEYIKTAFKPSATGRVFGRVLFQRASFEEPARPAAGYRVVLSQGETAWTATTNANGHYEFPAVPAGTYDIRVVVADTERAYGGPNYGRRLEVVDPRGCASADFGIVANGRIVTRVLDTEGNPRPGLTFEVVEAHEERRYAASGTSGVNGELAVAPLRPGRYLLGVNTNSAPTAKQPYPRLYYPGASDPAGALVIELSAGERRELDPFVLPAPLAQRQLTGYVIWPDGRPAARTHVSVLGERTSWVTGSGTTDAEGKFTIAVYEGVTYTVTASHTGPAPQSVRSQARLEGVTIQGELAPVRLVLRRLPR